MRQSAAVQIGTSSSDFSPILSSLQEIHAKYQGNFSGRVATYIPELTKADPRLFGIALVTADGKIYEVGDARHPFTIQSISKPFVYGLALEDHGLDYVLSKVGVEPSGEAFNSMFSTNAVTVLLIRWSMPELSPSLPWSKARVMISGWAAF
jgi:glutaminase